MECGLFLQGTDSRCKVRKEDVMKYSPFIKDFVTFFPYINEITVPYNLSSFVAFVNGGDLMNRGNIVRELILSTFLQSEPYLMYLIKYLQQMEKVEVDRILSDIPYDLVWNIYHHLPLSYIPAYVLTNSFISRYRQLREVEPIKTKKYTVELNEKELYTLCGSSIEGVYFSFHNDGSLKEKTNWHKGVKDGLEETWYSGGARYYRGYWKGGYKIGLHESWYSSGTKYFRTNWLNGFQHGLHEHWLTSERCFERSNWSHGQLHGLLETWYSTGQPCNRSMWKNGLLHGLAESWDISGKYIDKKNWSNGKLDGLSEIWYHSGIIKEWSNWKEGKRDGITKKWSEDGILQCIEIWLDSRLVTTENK